MGSDITLKAMCNHTVRHGTARSHEALPSCRSENGHRILRIAVANVHLKEVRFLGHQIQSPLASDRGRSVYFFIARVGSPSKKPDRERIQNVSNPAYQSSDDLFPSVSIYLQKPLRSKNIALDGAGDISLTGLGPGVLALRDDP